MEWPATSVSVPPYLAKGMSFDDMLHSYKQFVRGLARDNIDEEGDARMGSERKGKTSVQVSKKSKGGGIAKESKKRGSLYDSKRPSAGGVTVVVKNIPFATNEGGLRNHFNHIGRILHVSVDRDANNKSLGSGTVTFNSRKEANVALDSMQNTRLADRPIRITLAP